MVTIPKRIKDVITMFSLKAPNPFDYRTGQAESLMDNLLGDLFDACSDEASVKLRQKGFRPGEEALRCYVAYAQDFWAQAATEFNSLKIELIPKKPGCDHLVIDDRGYIAALLLLPSDLQGPLKPILSEYMEEEAKLHPEYIKPNGSNKQPEIRLTRAQFDDIVPVDRLMERQLLAAYFDTYSMLSVYRGMHDYDDPKAKELAVRMELIMKRMEEQATGVV